MNDLDSSRLHPAFFSANRQWRDALTNARQAHKRETEDLSEPPETQGISPVGFLHIPPG